ncbi:MAG: TetR/AcrR family transcriptional regulator, partial [Acidobacteriota bacterium]|nr:TetR/AcrR family transcriptional regulator [Acidobacteriota bacterium]
MRAGGDPTPSSPPDRGLARARPGKTPPPRRRMPGAQRSALILEAALEEFARHGYDGASMGRIGAAAGVSRTVLYDYFPGKRALFVALLERTHAGLLAHLRERIAAEAAMEERMRSATDAFLAFAEHHAEAWSLLFPDHAPIDPDVARDHRHEQAASNRLLAELIAPDAKRAGIEPQSPVGQAIFALQQAALLGAVRWWRAHPGVSRAEIVSAVMGLMWTGIGGLER